MTEPTGLDVELLRQELLATRLPQHEHGGYEVTATDAFLTSLIDRVASLMEQNAALNRTVDRITGERDSANDDLEAARRTVEELEVKLRSAPPAAPPPASASGLPTAPATTSPTRDTPAT